MCRRILMATAVAGPLIVIALAAAPWLAALCGQLAPGPHIARLTAVPSLIGIWTGRSYAYLLLPQGAQPVGDDAVLIDTGSDPAGVAILEALAAVGCTAACVGTVLLTHGHNDHTAALDLFAHAEVMAHPADGALLRGDLGPRSPLMRLVMRLTPRQRHVLRTVDLWAGHSLKKGGHSITVVGLPGHTDGSLGYLVGGGLIAGDAIAAASVAESALRPGAPYTADHPEVIDVVLRRLDGVDLAWVADGHTGLALAGESSAPSAPCRPRELCRCPRG